MKQIKHSWVSTEVEVPFDIEHLKKVFDDINDCNNKVDIADLPDLLEIRNIILSEDEIKQLPKLYNEWYSKDENCPCREEVKRVLDNIYEKYPNADVESCINDYFG